MLLLGAMFAKPLVTPDPGARRLEVLFFGAPTANHPGHDPVTRYRALKKHLGTEGIDFTYTQDPAEALNAGTLAKYDAVMMYGNWDQNGPMPADQLKALKDYVEGGGAFLPIHCASACYGGSPDFIKLVGGRFKEHGTGVFKVTNVNQSHPIMRDYGGFSAWDETYVHDQHGDDRVILEKREQEPWTWVREQGKGRIFYTAAGHDHRVWDLPEFQGFMKRAIFWSVGPEKYKKLQALQLPKLEQEKVELPGYLERKLITEAQKPLSPEDSMKLAQVPAGFELSLFASEPDIVNPIFVNWDHKGRAFVIQTVDYPNNLHAGNLGNDKIIICDDTDHDGRADKFTTFADKLSIPTSLVFANGGVICTNGSDMLFLQDTNGDDKADVRKVLFSGFNMGDTHAGVSNLRSAPDGWIYATVGYSGFDGMVGGEQHTFYQAVFRFKPDASKLEVLQGTTNNTWGLGFNSDFDVMGSTANANPSFYLTFPQTVYASSGMPPSRTPRADDNPIFNPSSADIRQVDQFDRYTAAAGHAFYTAERFPQEWREKTAFVTEATGKLVGTFGITREGAGFKADQHFNNLYNSADAWSGPVCAEVGPDGAVWICDWYNLIIQHNPTPSKASSGLDAKTGKGNAYETPVRKDSLGRIYRVYPKGTKDDANPGLDSAKPDTLIAALSHPNLFWRIQAKRLLVEGGNKQAAPKLAELARSGERGGAEAIRALADLGVLDPQTIGTALNSPVRSIQRAAIDCATPDQLKAAFIATAKLGSLPPRELAEVLTALSKGPSDPATSKAIFEWAKANEKALVRDPVLKDAWQIAANRLADQVILAAASDGFGSEEEAPAPPNLLPNPDFSKSQGGLAEGWTRVNTHGGAGRPDLKVSLSPDGRNGTTCLRIECAKPSDSGPAAMVRVEKHTRYRLTGWLRTENHQPYNNGPGAVLNIQGGDRTKGVKGTSDWTQVSMEFDSEDQDRIIVNCLFGGYGGATGTAFFDDVSLTEISGGSGLAGMLRLAALHFTEKADGATREAMAAALQGKSGGFAKKLLAQLKAAPAAPAVTKEKKKKFKVDPAVHARGKEVYAGTCIACHQPDGKGLAAAFPPLDGSEWLTADPAVPIRILLHGLVGPVKVAGQEVNSVMPAHVDLDDQKISDVLTYVRQSWTNDAAAVSPDEVKVIREKNAARTTPWTATELGH
jgi:putative membrane-bound dehydrogenase-like protein